MLTEEKKKKGNIQRKKRDDATKDAYRHGEKDTRLPQLLCVANARAGRGKKETCACACLGGKRQYTYALRHVAKGPGGGGLGSTTKDPEKRRRRLYEIIIILIIIKVLNVEEDGECDCLVLGRLKTTKTLHTRRARAPSASYASPSTAEHPALLRRRRGFFFFFSSACASPATTTTLGNNIIHA